MELKRHTQDLFSKLSPEVLGHIFIHCLPPESEAISPKSGPLLLVQVCHRWREVARGTPSLWQNINMGQEWPENPFLILDLFLAKSGNLPLTITFPFDGWFDKNVEQHEAIINKVLDDFHRVLSFKGHSELFPYLVFKRLSAPGAPRYIYAPLLKHLEFESLGFPPELSKEEDREFINNCIISPNLEELHLDSRQIMLSMVSFPPESLKVLTGLCSSEVAEKPNLSLLQKTINLEKLQFSLYDHHEATVFRFPSSVFLPNLKHLDASFYGAQFTEIVHSLHCPAIEKLTLGQSNVSYPNFVELLTKGQTPPLRSLHLSSAGPNAELSSFYRFKEVEELAFYALELDDVVIQMLMEKEGREFRLFPQLSSITIGAIFNSNQCDSLLAVLKSRCITNGGTLTYVKFFRCQLETGDENNIQALQNELDGKLEIDIVEETDYESYSGDESDDE